jgi:hypothetical protein
MPMKASDSRTLKMRSTEALLVTDVAAALTELEALLAR